MGFNKKFFTTGGIVASSAGAIIDNFDVVAYTGNGGTKSISSLDFQPDLVWVKDRDNSNPHELSDSVRGVSGTINTNSTNAEYVNASYQITSFDTNGFTVVDDSAGNYAVNGNGIDYVAWCWKAAGAANTFNVLEGGTVTSDSTASGAGITAGSITTGWEVSANRDAGFSIVKYTGNGTAGSSIGHGLSAKPELIFWKNLSATSNWLAYADDIATNHEWLYLNLTSSLQASGLTNEYPTNKQRPTNSLVYVNGSGSSNNINISGQDTIMYCFHSVDGYQKIGSYSGLGTSAVTVTTGFEPRFLLIKRYDSTGGNWYIYDQLRDGTNDRQLYANTSDQESTTADVITYNSDGFTVASSGSGVNASSSNYIYLAIA